MPRTVGIYDPKVISEEDAITRATNEGLGEIAAGIPPALSTRETVTQEMLDAGSGWYAYTEPENP